VLKVFLILFLVIYLIIVMINMLVKPFMQGYNKQNAGSGRGGDSKGKLIITYNPEKGKKNNKGRSDDYVDYEEVKEE
jgi:hypothetical protein